MKKKYTIVKTKVRAFTLNEMVIVMIISAIVFGLAFTVLGLIQRHMWSIQENFQIHTEFNRLEQALWIDTNRYNSINYNSSTSEVIFKTALDTTKYYFKPDYVIKDRDTFYLNIEEMNFYFNGKDVGNGNIDALKLSLPKQFKNQNIFIYKYNDATQFVK